jgi:mono/diheme cytochrome c family protein
MNRWLRRILKGLGILFGVLAVLAVGLVVFVQLTWDRPSMREIREMTAPTDAQTVARGEYLFKYTMGCWSCHGSEGSRSPDEPQAGGLEFDLSGVGPGFGVIYAANITPDPATGIGDWTDGELVRALREGLDRDGQLIFPIMAYEFWHELSDEDSLALVAYMRSLPPVSNEVPPARPSFPARALRALGMLGPKPPVTASVAAPPEGPTEEYGKYLAWQASGCAECHMPRNPNTGQFDMTRTFAGGLFPIEEQGFSTTASNLTPDIATGIGNWSEQDFLALMRTGTRPDGTVSLPFMPWPLYAEWSEDDLHAVWLYLSSLEPISHEVPSSTLAGAAVSGSGADRGEALFDVYCLICHGEKGEGAPFTSVALRDAAESMDDVTLTKFITDGITGTSMPSWKETLTDDEIEDVIAFIRTWQR